MSTLPLDPLASEGLAGFARRFRTGELPARAVTDAYLARIEQLDPRLDAFVHVAPELARSAADAMDALRAAGTDLGPLMGVPVAVKDLFAVDGMPARAGSRLDLGAEIGAEGPFVRALRRAGCIILGKTRTIEFAAGAHNVSHPTPWNPCDAATRRTPGGSSSGSAVAVSAGLCPLAIGSDTGGSVRVPAALCGVSGLKPSTGFWPLDGVFPLCPDMDTVGLLTASVEDAVLAFQALGGKPVGCAPPLPGWRVGVYAPGAFAMDPSVRERYEAALEQMERAGVQVVTVPCPDRDERELISRIYAEVVATDLLVTLGRERFAAEQHRIDPLARRRIAGALDTPATDYARLRRARHALAEQAGRRVESLDAILTPTTPVVPRPLESVAGLDAAEAFIGDALGISRLANVYDQCALSVPLPGDGSDWPPVGLQLAARHGMDDRLLGLARGIERLLGRVTRADMSAFV